VLFGNVLGIGFHTVLVLAAMATVTLAALTLIARPLLFASLQPELAEAKGVHLELVSTLFMVIVAIATAEATQIVGVLLVFALMVAPAATALHLTRGVLAGVILSILIAVATAWASLALAYITDWPTSFFITALGALAYLSAGAASRLRAA
jgi:zinc/manganese transport system permease protein